MMTAMRIAVVVSLLLAAWPASSAEFYAGAYQAEVLRIIDGDTLEARVAIWPDLEAVVSVRLRGVDTPESYGPKCAEEKAAARAATDFLAGLAPPGSVVRLEAVGPDKYAGRVDARLRLLGADGGPGRDVAAAIVAAGHGRPYSGGKRGSWC